MAMGFVLTVANPTMIGMLLFVPNVVLIWECEQRMADRDECKECGEPLVKVKTQYTSFWRHIKISKNFTPHRPWAAREFEESERRWKTKICNDEHPKFQMVFCTLKPNHEGNHRSRSGIEWELLVEIEKEPDAE